MVTYKLQIENGRYFTEPILSKEEWLTVLHTADNPKHSRQLDVIRMFIYQPGHKATCAKIGKEYSMNPTAVNSLVQHFCHYVQNNCGKEFRLEAHENNKETFWPIAMVGTPLKDGHFEWELRTELVAAMQQFLIEKLIKKYRGPVLAEGLNNSRSEELYKWKIIASTQGKDIAGVLEVMGNPSNEMNLLDWRTKDSIRSLLKSLPEKLTECFSLLLSTDGGFYDKFNKFVEYGRTFLSKTDADKILREKEASLFLSCNNPQENALYKWSLYKDVCGYLGIDTNDSRPVDDYMAILKEIIAIETKDTELVEKLKTETADYFWSDLLNAQDVLWQLQGYMRESRPKNWLQQIYDEAISSRHWVYEEWFPEYKVSIRRFCAMFDEGKTAADVDEQTKDYFIRANENYISSNPQGKYSNAEYANLLPLWPQMWEILKRNVEADTISREDYDEMNRLMQPSLSKQHPAAYHRLWAGLFPYLLTTIITDSKFRDVYNRVRSIDSSLPEPTGYWLQDNMAIMAYFKEKVTFREPLHQALFAWYLFENLNVNDNYNDMEQYIEILRANRNLVLTGAPGTGKTYLARQIAKKMGDDDPGFVQFHPSYDYTDFVEGLRPNDEGTFERVNGTFKQFCADALSGLKTSDFDKAYDKLLADLSEMDKPMKLTTPNSGALFAISLNKRGSLNLHTGADLVKQGSLTRENIRDQIRGETVYNYWKGYFEGVVKLLKDKYGLCEGTPNPVPTNHVFIIDEINRGELSKIFGELFFAIEPDYRGKEHPVKTQYQNLVEPGDPFYKGFYVPENVYIIGTMNDIDRGVESMDFAIRRRFAWMEVKAEDRVDMLDIGIPDWSYDAKRCMTALNAALKEKEIGLTSAYDIGPAYFRKLALYDGDFEKLWKYHIQGVLEEYLRGTRNIDDKMTRLKEAFDKYKTE